MLACWPAAPPGASLCFPSSGAEQSCRMLSEAHLCSHRGHRGAGEVADTDVTAEGLQQASLNVSNESAACRQALQGARPYLPQINHSKGLRQFHVGADATSIQGAPGMYPVHGSRKL